METENKYTRFDAEIIAEIARHQHIESDEYENFLYYSDAEYPAKLINEIRPGENPEVKEYRKKTYQAVFAEVFDRVLNALNKIQRSDGYYLKYPQEISPKISKGEDLQSYLTYNFTASKSLMNWAFQVGLKQYVIDANGVIIVWSDASEPTEYKKPKPFIINSDRIIYTYEGKSVVYKDEHDRDVFYSVDDFAWSKWRRKKRGQGYELAEAIEHGLGIFPGFTIGGVVEEEEELGREYQSRFQAMLPWLNVATVEFSDLRAEITQHIFSTVWIYQDEQCPACNGQGFLIKENEKVPCTNSKCKGGQIPKSPYETLRVRPAKTSMGEVPAPTPPMGYVQKQTEIAELQDRRINEMRYRSLAAVNMQFLEVQPTAQSGVAKAYDRDETNNTFYGVAVDLGTIMTNIAYLCAKWRYNLLYPNDADIRAMVPIMIVPNTFDIIGSQLLVDEIKAAKDSTLNDAVLSEMELEYINKRFPNDVVLQNRMRDAFSLDPASGKSDDEKGMLVSNRMMSKQDAVISTYIFDFVERAYAENPTFAELDKKTKQSILSRYADEKLRDINAKDILTTQIFGTQAADTTSGGKSPADLKYTVGGLTGIIEIVKAVSSGVYDLEAAINMVMDRFGLTYEQAKAQLGTPQIITSAAQLDKITQLT